ncbi:hypothetical protein HDU93_006937 [Gonapodya sp. JEL0774]|nr:hypothetical protein HDU93_006937 [Gonapodya sp. JEL0774]
MAGASANVVWESSRTTEAGIDVGSAAPPSHKRNDETAAKGTKKKASLSQSELPTPSMAQSHRSDDSEPEEPQTNPWRNIIWQKALGLFAGGLLLAGAAASYLGTGSSTQSQGRDRPSPPGRPPTASAYVDIEEDAGEEIDVPPVKVATELELKQYLKDCLASVKDCHVVAEEWQVVQGLPHLGVGDLVVEHRGIHIVIEIKVVLGGGTVGVGGNGKTARTARNKKRKEVEQQAVRYARLWRERRLGCKVKVRAATMTDEAGLTFIE